MLNSLDINNLKPLIYTDQTQIKILNQKSFLEFVLTKFIKLNANYINVYFYNY